MAKTKNNAVSYFFASSKIGSLTIAENEFGICAVLFGKDVAELQKLFPKALLNKITPAKSRWGTRALELINEPQGEVDVPLFIEGSDFQRAVWMELLEIPLGATLSYKDIASAIGKPSAYRAVANACGANKIPVLIPCHRVIAADGSIGGYGGGLAIKRKLFKLENIELA